jgi:hypothetical protein
MMVASEVATYHTFLPNRWGDCGHNDPHGEPEPSGRLPHGTTGDEVLDWIGYLQIIGIRRTRK